MKVKTPDTRQTGKSSKTAIALGSFLMLLGLVAIARPTYATLASTLVFGCIFLFAGINYLIYALRTLRFRAFPLHLLLSLLCLGTGILLLSNLVRGAIALTLILGISLFLLGCVQVFLAFLIRPATRWGWVLVSGIAGILFGTLIWSAWPVKADWLMGFWVGLHFFGQGVLMVGLPVPRR